MTYTQDEIKDLYAAAARETDPWRRAAAFGKATRALHTIDADLSPGDKYKRDLEKARFASQPVTFPPRATIEQKIGICLKRCAAASAAAVMATKTSLEEKLDQLCKLLGLPAQSIPGNEKRRSSN